MTKIRLTITVTREYEVDYDDYVVHNEGEEPKKLSKEEAKAYDIKCVKKDPISFIDAADAVEVEAKIEELS